MKSPSGESNLDKIKDEIDEKSLENNSSRPSKTPGINGKLTWDGRFAENEEDDPFWTERKPNGAKFSSPSHLLDIPSKLFSPTEATLNGCRNKYIHSPESIYHKVEDEVILSPEQMLLEVQQKIIEQGKMLHLQLDMSAEEIGLLRNDSNWKEIFKITPPITPKAAEKSRGAMSVANRTTTARQADRRSLDESRDPLKLIDTVNTHIPQKYISPTSKYAAVQSRFLSQIETKADLSSATDDTFIPHTNITSNCKYANLPSRLMDETTASTSAQKMKYEVPSPRIEYSPRSSIEDSPRAREEKETVHGQKRSTSNGDERIFSGIRDNSTLSTPTKGYLQRQWKLTPEQHLIKLEKEKDIIKSHERISKLMKNRRTLKNEKRNIDTEKILFKVKNDDFRTEIDDVDMNEILISDSNSPPYSKEIVGFIPSKEKEPKTSIKIEKSPYARGKTTPTHTPRSNKAAQNSNGKFVSQIPDILVDVKPSIWSADSPEPVTDIRVEVKPSIWSADSPEPVTAYESTIWAADSSTPVVTDNYMIDNYYRNNNHRDTMSKNGQIDIDDILVNNTGNNEKFLENIIICNINETDSEDNDEKIVVVDE